VKEISSWSHVGAISNVKKKYVYLLNLSENHVTDTHS